MPITFDFSPLMRRRESERAFQRQMLLAESRAVASEQAAMDRRKAEMGAINRKNLRDNLQPMLALMASRMKASGDPNYAVMEDAALRVLRAQDLGEFATPPVVQALGQAGQTPLESNVAALERAAPGTVREEALRKQLVPQFNQPQNIYRMNPDGSMTFAGAGRFNREAGVTTYQDGSPLGPQDVPVPVQMQASNLQDVGGLPAGARGTAHKKLFELEDQMARLEQVENSLSPEFLEYLPRLQAAATAVAEKAGFKPSAESRRFLAEESKFKANTMRNYNITLAELSGAAVTASEAKRFKPVDPNMDDSYTQFVAKLESGKAYVRSAITRYKDLIDRGVIRDGDKVTEQVAADNPLTLYRSPYAGMSLQELIDTPPADADGINRPWLWDQYIEAMQRAQ